LALDFEDFLRAFIGNCGMELSATQRAQLVKVDELLSAMSGAANADLWTEKAVCDHPRWAEVRLAARDAIAVLGWMDE